MKEPTFATYNTVAEHRAAEKIVKRAYEMFRSAGLSVEPITIAMDLAAVHGEIPLLLVELADAEDFDFAHDLGGINRHMDRETGELGGCFVPRYAQRPANGS